MTFMMIKFYKFVKDRGALNHSYFTNLIGCFDEFYALAKEELAFTRGSEGCISIHTSSSRDTNTLNLLRFGKARKILIIILQKELSVAGKTLRACWKGRQKKNVSRLMIGVTEKSGKNNLDTNTDRAREKYVKSKRCPRILSHKKSPDRFRGEIDRGVKSTEC
jgi:hypothetical protein